MIRVKVFAPFGLGKARIDERGWMEMESGATLGDAIQYLGWPPVLSRILMVRLNGLRQPLDTPLKDGDVIGYFSLIAGG